MQLAPYVYAVLCVRNSSSWLCLSELAHAAEHPLPLVHYLCLTPSALPGFLHRHKRLVAAVALLCTVVCLQWWSHWHICRVLPFRVCSGSWVGDAVQLRAEVAPLYHTEAVVLIAGSLGWP